MKDKIVDYLLKLTSGNEQDKQMALKVAYKLGEVDAIEKELNIEISEKHKELIEFLISMLI